MLFSACPIDPNTDFHKEHSTNLFFFLELHLQKKYPRTHRFFFCFLITNKHLIIFEIYLFYILSIKSLNCAHSASCCIEYTLTLPSRCLLLLVVFNLSEIFIWTATITVTQLTYYPLPPNATNTLFSETFFNYLKFFNDSHHLRGLSQALLHGWEAHFHGCCLHQFNFCTNTVMSLAVSNYLLFLISVMLYLPSNIHCICSVLYLKSCQSFVFPWKNS